jgi:hypothetical protein
MRHRATNGKEKKTRRMRRWESGEYKNKGNKYKAVYLIQTFLLS